MRNSQGVSLCAILLLASCCDGTSRSIALHEEDATPVSVAENSLPVADAAPLRTRPQAEKLAIAAIEQVGVTTIYDPSYLKIAYPGGDVPPERGVCTDVLVRAFRRLGIDLQYLFSVRR